MKIIASLLALLATVAYAADPPTPQTATKDAPFVNSLGMKFVPVEITGGPTNGKRVLFSIWDTRVQDYAEYAKAETITPEKANFEQEPTHPVVMVSWEDAKSFCQWLTKKDHSTRKIGAQDVYRLPSDHEWSCAVGIGEQENAALLPMEKTEKLAHVFPWGSQWPPPKGAGNYARLLYVDEFKRTSPVGSFSANRYGLYDMGGNVWQWCEDWFDKEQKDRVLRGASWMSDDELDLRSSCRSEDYPTFRDVSLGFRCVLEVPGSDEKE